MLIQMHRKGLYLAPDEAGGGAGTAVADRAAGGAGAGAVEAGTAEVQPTETETEAPGGEGEGTEGAGERPQGTGRTYTDSDMAGMRRSLEAGFEKKLHKATEELRQSLTGEFSTLRKDVDTLKPAPKDLMDTWIENLPDGDEDAAEGSKARQEAEFKKDAKAVAPLLKQMRPVLLPEMGEIQAIQAGLAVSFDKLRFLSEELTTFAKEVSEAMATGNPEALKQVKLPAGLTHLEKIEATRKETFEKSGRQTLPTYRGTFETLMKTAQAEEASAVKSEAEIRADERTRLEREGKERKAAAGAPGNAAPAPRGAGASKPGRRTPAEIEQASQDGPGFLLP